MGSESPNAVLYDSAGNALAVTPGSAIPASNSALLLAGTDGTNARTISVDTSGRTVLVGAGTAGTPAGGVISIQGVSGGQALPTTISGTVTVTGTVTATNPSVSTTAAAVPASATYIGGAVQAVQSGLTLGDLYPLSMTQTGLLRVDGSNVTQPVSIATSVTVIQPTAASLNATVTGTVAATQSGTWTVQPGNTANTTPWLATINQGGNSVGVTAASTAAVATQPSLVTSFSPNSQLPTGTNIIGITTPVNDDTATGTLTATAQTQAFLVNSGRSSISWQFTGTWTGTINFEKSLDGANWVPMAFYTGTDTTNSTTVNGIYYSSLGSTQNVRIRTSGVWTGTVTWTVARSVGVKAFGIQDSIPSGTNTIGTTNQGTANTLANAWSAKITDATNGPAAVKAASTAAIATDPALVVAISPNNSITSSEADPVTATSYPDQGNYTTTALSPPSIDGFGNLITRGVVLTDEGSFRDDFSGTALTTAITGNLTFTNGSVTVTGTNLQTQIRTGQYIKKTADAETLYVQVSSIDSATSLTLVTTYAGTSAAAASVVSNWQTVTPSGGSIVVASSIFTLNAGTTASATGNIRSLGDYLPYSAQFYGALSQRIANQTFYFGFEDVVGAPNQQAIVQFTGTVNTTANFITSFDNGSSIQTTPFTFPNGNNSGNSHLYKIDLSANQATLSIDGIIVAFNTLHLPSPYTLLFITAGVINGGTAPASGTSLTLDYVFFQNIDRVQIDNDFNGEPIVVAGNTTIAGSTALATIDSEHTRPTYFMSLQGFATGTTNQDVFNLIGSATKVIRVTRVRFSMTTTTAVTIPVQLIKRSTANTGGTGGVAVLGPYDSNDAAATATNFAYTANATTFGTVVGTAVRSDKYFALVATPTTAAQVLDWEFGNHSKCPTLRGTAQQLCINLGGVTIAGGNVSISFEWTEDYA